jgi:hypothetical protein
VTLPDERLQALPPFAGTALTLLVSLSGEDATTKGLDPGLLSDHLANLLFGRGNPDQRLSDTALVKLFRLLRLARRLFDLEADRVN